MNKEIISDAKKLVNTTIESDTRNMNETERKAYDMGVNNAFCAIETLEENELKLKFKQLCGGGKGRHTRKQIVAKHSGSSPACNFCIGKGMAIL